jgi:hypothetical protein
MKDFPLAIPSFRGRCSLAVGEKDWKYALGGSYSPRHAPQRYDSSPYDDQIYP